MSAAMEALRLGLPLPAYMQPRPAQPAPLILTPMSDWRADPYPYPLRSDDKPRAVWPQGVSQ